MDLKIKYQILPVRFFPDAKVLCHFYWSRNEIHAFKDLSIPTANPFRRSQFRTEVIYSEHFCNTAQLENIFFSADNKLWND